MKCRIQIRLTESNYWRRKIPIQSMWTFLSTSSHSDVLRPPLSPLSFSLYYFPLFPHWNTGLFTFSPSVSIQLSPASAFLASAASWPLSLLFFPLFLCLPQCAVSSVRIDGYFHYIAISGANLWCPWSRDLLKAYLQSNRQDHWKLWQCFNCCWHQLNVIRANIFFGTHWQAIVGKQHETVW